MTKEDKNHISPLDYHNVTKSLAKKIEKSRFKPDVIAGVSRGGLVPAVYMSHLLGKIPMYSVRVSMRDWSEFYIQEIFEKKLKSGSIKNVLVVDDIADSGEVIRLLKNYFKSFKGLKVKFATVYSKKRCLDEVDYCGQITDGRWIVFPYEKLNK